MKARPIIYSGPMVLALLDGRKTQTRRIVKPEPLPGARFDSFMDGRAMFTKGPAYGTVRCPYGRPGDLLIVREAFTVVPTTAYRMSQGVQQTVNPTDRDMAAIYSAGWDRSIPNWKPSIHMPRWASRLTLEITDVRVERLQEISEADAIAEGIIEYDPTDEDPAEFAFEECGETWNNGVSAYQALWRKINGHESWAANPWVWVVEFRAHQVNVDHLIQQRGVTP